MKTKLNLTLEAEIVDRFKHLAREQGCSMSSIVEEHVRQLTHSERPPFSQRWTGRLELAGAEDDRYRALVNKYIR